VTDVVQIFGSFLRRTNGE